MKLVYAFIAVIYGMVVHIRNFLFDIKVLRSVTFNIPTICVGNLTVGGTGKTPHVEYLIKLLSEKYNVATLSRGYKRKTKGFILASASSTASQIGDEPHQIYSKHPNINVAVDEKRVRGIKSIIEEKPDTDVILLDDAFQHRYVKPGHSILLVDYNNLVTRDYFLPLGRLRDSISQLHRAETVIITKCPANIKPIDQRIISKELKLFPYQDIFFTSYSYGCLSPVFNDLSQPTTNFENYKILAFAGIANPKPFFNHLDSNFNLVDTIEFPDHFNFTEKKIKAIFEKFSHIEDDRKIIVTTEKDASRLKEYKQQLSEDIKRNFYYIPIEVEFLNGATKDFNNKIFKYVRKSKRDHGLHPK